MTSPNRHRVQRQVLELALGPGAEGPAVHRELARPFWDRAVPELEKVFDRAAGPRHLLRLDRLEIDLGRIDGPDWPLEFRRKLVAELARSLDEFTVAPESGDAAAADPPAERWQQFLFFLVHGRLPWWAARPVGEWTTVLLGEAGAAEWKALRETACDDPRVRERLVYSVGDEFLDRAVEMWSGLPHAARVLTQLTPKSLPAGPRRRWRRAFWITVLEWVFTGGPGSRGEGRELLRDLLARRRLCVPEPEPRAATHLFTTGNAEPGGSSPLALGEVFPDPWHEWLPSVSDVQFAGPASDSPADAGIVAAPGPAISGSKKDSEAGGRPLAVEEDAIYLDGAGTILLHPFLEPLFRDRGLLDGPVFRDTDARGRAVHLLGLLAFGRTEVPEHDLLLPKLLCGAPFEEPLEPVPLDEPDLDACGALLRAVLAHWTALRSSSPQWMREQFFLREGKLQPVDAGYRLTIERRAQDVLLARLPWGCGFVALPWLNDRIFVHWLD